jgi:hypothetical protein
MDPRKQALQEFLTNSKQILKHHLETSAKQGKIKGTDIEEMLATYDDRAQIILDVFNREASLKQQEGGGVLDKAEGAMGQAQGAMNQAQGAMGQAQGAMNSLQAYSPDQIQKNIDKLMHFSPKNSLPNTVEPVIEKSMWIFVPQVRETVKQILGSFFVLGSLEKLPIFGPFVGAAMDVATAYLPALAITVQNMLPNLIGLAPIPYASFAGEAAGYAVSAVMLFFTVMTQVSRGEFVEAVVASTGLIPVVVTTLMSYVGKGKKLYEKYQERRDQILQSLAKIQGLLLFLLPLATSKVKPLITKLFPIFNTFLKEAGKYAEVPANFVINSLKPIVKAAKDRLTKRFPAETQKGGRKKRRNRNRKTRRKQKRN